MYLNKIIHYYENNGFFKTVSYSVNRILWHLRNLLALQIRFILTYENQTRTKNVSCQTEKFDFKLVYSLDEISTEIYESFQKTMKFFFKTGEPYLELFDSKNSMLLVSRGSEVVHFEFVNFNDQFIFPPLNFDRNLFVYIWEVHTLPSYRGNNLYIESLKFLAENISKNLLLTTRLSNKIALNKVKKFGFKRKGILIFLKWFKKEQWQPIYFLKP